MKNKIDNLDALLAEKARVRAQLRIVENELSASARKTREGLKVFVEDKLSLSNQLGQLFQGGARQALGSSAISAAGRAVGMSSWWTGVLTMLGPVLVNYIQKQFKNRKARRQDAAPANGDKPKAAPAKAKKRGLFKRKSKPAAEPEEPASE
ncbi:MAG: hypothetical protein JNK89_10580 [Saprospiraceae bacterium]|nr:hypothetical protein [Saprospiraceae bacterium]